jgi:hypothetical protein
MTTDMNGLKKHEDGGEWNISGKKEPSQQNTS